MDLVTFLRARLDEDEALAKGAAEPFLLGDRTGMQGLHPQILRYVYRHTPGRHLPDIEAKRRIVRMTHHAVRDSEKTSDDPENGRIHGRAIGLLEACEALALPYADHPDYDPEWRP